MKATTGRIWEAASTEPNWPVLTYVSFDAKKATLTATNSYVMARVPCEVEDGDESGLIPATALKEAKGASLRVADGKATLKLKDGGERSWPLLADGKFPDADKILKDTVRADVRFGLNASLLRDLSEALGANGHIALHPVHPLKAMIVEGSRDTVGILMPVRLPDTNGGALPVAPDLSDDASVVAAVKAAVAALDGRRGKKKAAQAFRDALVEAASAA